MKIKLKSISLFLLTLVFLVGHGFGIARAQERFIANADGTVTDREAGLMWSQIDNESDILWKDALPWIKNRFDPSASRKFTSWRLPTVEELQSLFIDGTEYPGYRAACGHRVKIIPQIRISCILVWSSDSALGLPIAFNFNLGNAFTVNLHDKAGCRVLAVRNIE